MKTQFIHTEAGPSQWKMKNWSTFCATYEPTTRHVCTSAYFLHSIVICCDWIQSKTCNILSFTQWVAREPAKWIHFSAFIIRSYFMSHLCIRREVRMAWKSSEHWVCNKWFVYFHFEFYLPHFCIVCTHWDHWPCCYATALFDSQKVIIKTDFVLWWDLFSFVPSEEWHADGRQKVEIMNCLLVAEIWRVCVREVADYGFFLPLSNRAKGRKLIFFSLLEIISRAFCCHSIA